MSRFSRLLGKKKYRKIFIIATEGKKTEQEYFSLLRNFSQATIYLCRQDNKSNPLYVLKRLKLNMTIKNIQETDEAWVVIDKDNWKDEDIQTIYSWAKKTTNRGVAFSNPRFEYWLLLHFDEGNSLRTKKRM